MAQCCDSRVSFRVPLSLCHTWRSHQRSVPLIAVRETQQSGASLWSLPVRWPSQAGLLVTSSTGAYPEDEVLVL